MRGKPTKPVAKSAKASARLNEKSAKRSKTSVRQCGNKHSGRQHHQACVESKEDLDAGFSYCRRWTIPNERTGLLRPLAIVPVSQLQHRSWLQRQAVSRPHECWSHKPWRGALE